MGELECGFEGGCGGARVGNIGLNESPVRESQANGAAEAAINVFQCQMRTPKNRFGFNMDLQKDWQLLPVDGVLMQWLVVVTTDILNRIRGRRDERTPYEITSGHVWRHPVLELGETVTFTVVRVKTQLHKADAEWCEGFMLVSKHAALDS